MKNILITILAVGLLASCQNAPKGEKAITGAAKEITKAATSASKTIKLLPGGMIGWSGKKLAGEHKGLITISEGSINVADDKITGGKFTIDMNSISCSDLAAGQGKEDLEGHLKSADFFNVAAHPTSTFEITNVAGNQETGNLTLLGVTKSITFPANMAVTPEGTTVTSPIFNINRTDWGLKYGSAKFFDVVKDKAINDQISLSVRFKAS